MKTARSHDLKPATDSGLTSDAEKAGGETALVGHELNDNEVATIEYIAEMSLNLKETSVKMGMPFLAYLLEMVFQEAHCVCSRVGFEPTGQQPASR